MTDYLWREDRFCLVENQCHISDVHISKRVIRLPVLLKTTFERETCTYLKTIDRHLGNYFFNVTVDTCNKIFVSLQKCAKKRNLQDPLLSPILSATKLNHPSGPNAFMNTKILIGILESINDFSKLVPCVPNGLKENRYFLVDNNVNARRNELGLKELYKDDSGPWNFQHSVTRYFLRDARKMAELKDGMYYTDAKRDKKRVLIPLDPQPTPDSVISVYSQYVRHKSCESYRRKITSFGHLSKEMPHIAIYEYCGNAPSCLKETLGDCSEEVYDNVSTVYQ